LGEEEKEREVLAFKSMRRGGLTGTKTTPGRLKSCFHEDEKAYQVRK